MVAERFVQLDHMTRGRAMLGCGPGALVSDAYMMGIEPVTQRQRMDESLTAIMALLQCDGPVTMKTDWFEMREARLHLAPYTEPHFPIAVASTLTPSGVVAAGKHGLGVLSLAAGLPGGPEALSDQWRIAEDTAAKHGKRMDRRAWRLVTNVHVAEDDELALRQVHAGERHETVTYFEETLGRPPGRSDDPLREGVRMGTTLVGSPETVAAGIRRLLEQTRGGTGGLLFRAQEWANRHDTLKSFELFARYVMPQFQGSLDTVADSNRWARERRRDIFGPNVEAIAKAYADAGREMPREGPRPHGRRPRRRSRRPAERRRRRRAAASSALPVASALRRPGILVPMAPRARFDKDYYAALGLPLGGHRGGGPKAYRRLALQWHPDRNAGEAGAAERFKEISEAYAVLVDPGKRRDYDRARQVGTPSSFRHKREDIFRDLFADPRASDVFEDLVREFERIGVRVDRRVFQQTLFGGRTVVTGGVFVATPPHLGARPPQAGARGHAGSPGAARGAAAAAAPAAAWAPRAPRRGRADRFSASPALPSKAAPSGRDLTVQLRLTRTEADRGGRKRLTVEREGGRDELLVTIPSGIRSGTRLRLRGKGRRTPQGPPGDLYLAVEVGD